MVKNKTMKYTQNGKISARARSDPSLGAGVRGDPPWISALRIEPPELFDSRGHPPEVWHNRNRPPVGSVQEPPPTPPQEGRKNAANEHSNSLSLWGGLKVELMNNKGGAHE